MSITRKLLASAFILAGAGHAIAASSIDLNIKGSITPSACTPSMSSGGTVDYGKLSAKDLNADRLTRLPAEYLQLRVDCDSAILFALQGHDNRAGSVPDGHEDNFGLGLINGDEKLGSFAVNLTSAVADDVPSRFIMSYDGGETWEPWPGGALWDGGTTAVADNSSFTPLPTKVLTGEMEIKTLIAPTNSLTLTEEVPIDGSVAVTVKYL
ncbi:DUF1120 domain-containing protein [Pseudomonas sp. 18.1.10]|uniref:DUF1120 domain-containing protein n=1 Tax=Pseudomonas sp. 18.1.10 TaxID=2969302 RepID=UPI0021504335|nr:DUF1120 domain-containing protein [Pseudomonas sp. 18.1.10]MCR4539238.1 DUF1120 domain-containing protein [Pseudomonas sp. 18.1.10]